MSKSARSKSIREATRGPNDVKDAYAMTRPYIIIQIFEFDNHHGNNKYEVKVFYEPNESSFSGPGRIPFANLEHMNMPINVFVCQINQRDKMERVLGDDSSHKTIVNEYDLGMLGNPMYTIPSKVYKILKEKDDWGREPNFYDIYDVPSGSIGGRSS